MQLSQFIDKALEVPFLDRGRSWMGWDCWGLVYMAYREVRNINLPYYTGQYSSSIRRNELNNLIKAEKQKTVVWSSVTDPEAMDGVLIRLLGRNCHIGLMIDKTHFIHAEAKVMTHIGKVDDIFWRGEGYDKIEGFYRYGPSK